jgi:hypothetical protein
MNRYDGMPQAENGVWTTPNRDRFFDPDGNNLSLTPFA